MPAKINKENSAFSTSAPRKSSPTIPSVFVFPEKTSRSGALPPRYGKQKISDSANISSRFSEASPLPPLFEHEDSVTLYGDRKFQSHGISRLKSRCSAPKASCPLKGKVEPEVSRQRTGRQLSSPPLSASSNASDNRKLLYSLYDIEDILPFSPPDAPLPAEFDPDRGIDSRDRVPYMAPFDLPDLPSNTALKDAHKKKQRKQVDASRRKTIHIETLCCNLAREFPSSVQSTYSSQSSLGKKPRGKSKPVLRSESYSIKQLRDTSQPALRSLAAGSFNSFIRQPDPVTVMFHNSITNTPETLEDWKAFSRASRAPLDLFATVDCAKESSLCAREGVSSFPLYKLYSKGSTMKVVEDMGQL